MGDPDNGERSGQVALKNSVLNGLLFREKSLTDGSFVRGFL